MQMYSLQSNRPTRSYNQQNVDVQGINKHSSPLISCYVILVAHEYRYSSHEVVQKVSAGVVPRRSPELYPKTPHGIESLVASSEESTTGISS